MKKRTKTALIASLILIFAGAAVAFAGLASINFDFKEMSTQKLYDKSCDINEEFEEISIECECDVALIATDSANARVEYSQFEDQSITARVQNGILEITENDERKWYEMIISVNFESPKIKIYLPKKDYRELVADTGVGDIKLDGGLCFESVELTASTGDISFIADANEKLQIETDTGDIAVKNSDALEMELHTDTGRIALTDSQIQTFSAESDTGDIHLDAVMISKTLEIKSDTGDVDISACDALELKIETQTGDVTGELLSEKIFITETDTGRISVPNSASGGVCSIKTDTGDISIKIKEK